MINQRPTPAFFGCLFPAVLVLALFPMACSSGGDDENIGSELTLSSTSHFFGLSGSTSFLSFPVTSGEVSPLAGLLLLGTDSSFQIKESGLTVADDDYQLEADGTMQIRLTQLNRPTVVWKGAIGLKGDSGDSFLSDRVGAVGLYLGTPALPGIADPVAMAGDWHLFTSNVLYSPAVLPDSDEIGRTFAANISLADDGSFTGSGFESTSPSATLQTNGTVAPFADGTFIVNADVDSVTRKFSAGGDTDLIFGCDDDESDGDSGLMAMMRHRTAVADLAEVAGTYHLGCWTILVSTSDSGFGSYLGTLELTDTGDFTMDVVNSFGASLTFTGSFTTSDTEFGALLFEIPIPGSALTEKWRGAIDEAYNTIVILDNVKEVRPDGQAALRFFTGVRLGPADPPPDPMPEARD
ncbi:MAG: hypothetical protein ACYTG5_02695 [Planctomycetota bacterium]